MEKKSLIKVPFILILGAYICLGSLLYLNKYSDMLIIKATNSVIFRLDSFIESPIRILSVFALIVYFNLIVISARNIGKWVLKIDKFQVGDYVKFKDIVEVPKTIILLLVVLTLFCVNLYLRLLIYFNL